MLRYYPLLPPFSMKTILITGANGQIGTELTRALLARGHRVITTDVSQPRVPLTEFELLDVQDPTRLRSLLLRNEVNEIYHLAAILSARGEQHPSLAWKINVEGTLRVLEAAHELHVERVFVPSSIAVFGTTTPKINTPQHTIIEPATMYGITKVAGEQLGSYFSLKMGLDVRSVRYPCTPSVRGGYQRHVRRGAPTTLWRDGLRGRGR